MTQPQQPYCAGHCADTPGIVTKHDPRCSEYPSRDQALEALALEEHRHNLTRRDASDLRNQIDRIAGHLNTAQATAHWLHDGDQTRCVKAICVDLRKTRAAL